MPLKCLFGSDFYIFQGKSAKFLVTTKKSYKWLNYAALKALNLLCFREVKTFLDRFESLYPCHEKCRISYEIRHFYVLFYF